MKTKTVEIPTPVLFSVETLDELHGLAMKKRTQKLCN